METGEVIPAVDTDDLKTGWQIRTEIPQGSIDEMIYRRACKPGADVVAISHRAAFLRMVIDTMPDEFAGLVYGGQPVDAVFAAFAQFPIALGAPIDLGGLLREIRPAKTPQE